MRRLHIFIGLFTTVVAVTTAHAQNRDEHCVASVISEVAPPEVQPVMLPNAYAHNDGGAWNQAWGASINNGEVLGVHRFQAIAGGDTITSIQTQWFQDMAIGAPARIAVWQDNGSGNPNSATLLFEQAVTVQANTSGTWNVYQLNTPVSVSGSFYIGFAIRTSNSPQQYGVGFRSGVPVVPGESYVAAMIAGTSFANTATIGFADNSATLATGHMLLRATGSNTGFTYQGKLKNSGVAYSGLADMQFRVYATSAGGTALATPFHVTGVSVNEGLFSVRVPFNSDSIYFGTQTDPYLEISVRTPGGSGTFTTLSPRQRITPAPTALVANVADYAHVSSWQGIDGMPPEISNVPWSYVAGGIKTTAGNVGIGNSNPGQPLDVSGRIQIRGDGTGETAGTWLSSPINAPVGRAFVGLQNDNSVGLYGPVTGWGLTMNTQTGHVGIGTQTPTSGASKFDINTGAASGNYGGMYMVSQIGGWPFYGFNAGGNTAWMYYKGSDSTWRVNNFGDNLILTGGGLLSVGTQAASSAGYRLELPNSAGPGGQGRANAWVTYSSREYKDNIKTFENPLDTIDRLRGVTFDWRNANADGSHTHDIGFIAEEIADVLPELVTRTADGKATGLDYGRVVPVAVEAIKAQRKEIADLKARLDAIEEAMSKMQK